MRLVRLASHRAGVEPAIVLGKPVGILSGGFACLALRLDRDFLARLDAFEQRVALDFLINEAVKLEMRQLQQPDRLHQLRRHHQGLRLAQL